MRKKLLLFLLAVMTVLVLSGCRRKDIPEDFNISFQYGETDSSFVTIDTYNSIITLGANQSEQLGLKISPEDKADIYTELHRNNLFGYEGEYRGTTSEPGAKVRFMIKFTSNGRTHLISGDNTTKFCKKKDTSSLLEFRDYMIEYIESLDEYKRLIG